MTETTHVYELNLSLETTAEINILIRTLKNRADLLTESERQYMFLTGLQKMNLTEHEIFEVFTNTDIDR